MFRISRRLGLGIHGSGGPRQWTRFVHRSNWDASKSRTKKAGVGRSRVAMGLLVLMPIISFGLGTWQVRRLKWKQDLISTAEAHLTWPPIDLPANVNPDVASSREFSFRRVRLQGKWDHKHEMLVGPRTRDGKTGYFVVTPFLRDDGSKPLLVHRGWISKEMGDHPERRSALSRPQGTVEILGLLQQKQKPNWTTPQSHPGEGMYYFMDIDTMAARTGSQAVYIKELFDNSVGLLPEQMAMQGVPIGAPAKAEFRNSHFQYILTWYGLSLITAASLVMVLKQRRAPKPGDALRAKLEHAKRWQ